MNVRSTCRILTSKVHDRNFISTLAAGLLRVTAHDQQVASTPMAPKSRLSRSLQDYHASRGSGRGETSVTPYADLSMGTTVGDKFPA